MKSYLKIYSQEDSEFVEKSIKWIKAIYDRIKDKFK